MKKLMLATVVAVAFSCTSNQDAPRQEGIAVDTLDSLKVDSLKIDTTFEND